jgi:hypothetical protein
VLFAGDREGFGERIKDWPPDIVAHARRLLTNGVVGAEASST